MGAKPPDHGLCLDEARTTALAIGLCPPDIAGQKGHCVSLFDIESAK